MRLPRTSLPVFGLLLSAAFAFGQQPAQESGKGPAKPAAKPDPNSLEGLITDALRSHPDLRVAESKVRDAEALLNQARFKVIQQVSAAFTALQSARSDIRVAEAVVDKYRRLTNSGLVSNEELQKALAELEKAKAMLTKDEAELNMLTGRSTMQERFFDSWQRVQADRSFAFTADGKWLAEAVANQQVHLWDARSITAVAFAPDVKVIAGTMSEKIRSALQKPVKIEAWKEPLPVADVIDYLKKKAGTDVPFRVQVLNNTPSVGAVDLMAGELPLSGWLAMIEDSLPSAVFVVREYGILMTARDRVPEGAIRLNAFLRSTEPKKDEAKKP